MRLRKGQAAAALAGALACAVVVAAASAPTAKSRSQHCAAIAKIPVVNTGPRTAYAAGGTYDDCAVATWYYTLRLKNNAGNTLQEDQGTGNYGQNLVVGTTVGCAGAIVHSFFYINAAGSGTSDTSGTNSNCAY